jgi:uncharacterized protein with von Willebrand factor type A (vWA) domain
MCVKIIEFFKICFKNCLTTLDLKNCLKKVVNDKQSSVKLKLQLECSNLNDNVETQNVQILIKMFKFKSKCPNFN